MYQVAETHTGLVFLLGKLAYKIKKPVVTDFLDFSTVADRERACAHEVLLNRRLAADSYLGIGHFNSPQGGDPEPVIVMRRHPEDRKLATLVRDGADVGGDLEDIAGVLARFHDGAHRGPRIDDEARVDAVTARWRENVVELQRYADGVVPDLDAEIIAEIGRLTNQFILGRAVLFAGRIKARRIVDGHADLLADDIFCLADGPALLDCLEFDDRLRYVDVVDDAAFLAMDLDYRGRPDLAEVFMRSYVDHSGDDAPASLWHFYIAYRAVVRAKVDCVRYTQGHEVAAADARLHLDVAARHLRAGAVRLILVGGAPGTGKSTLARALAERLGARVVSTDDVRAQMADRGKITGAPGTLGEGLYTAENVDAVYAAVLRLAHLGLCEGHTVVLDGTWRDPEARRRARVMAAASHAPLTELVCIAPRDQAATRIETRTHTTSQVTVDIAAALAGGGGATWPEAHPVDTTRPLAQSVAEATELCRITS